MGDGGDLGDGPDEPAARSRVIGPGGTAYWLSAALAAAREDRHRVAGPMPLTLSGPGHEVGGMKRIVILGGGTGGTLVANRLRRAFRPEAAEIIVVDRDG